LAAVAIDSLSAEVMALPFIMLMFGQLSLIGLVANLLVVPLVPYAMLLTAIAAGAGMFAAPVAGWLAWPANILLTYMLDIIHLLSGIPSIFLQRSVNLGFMISFYVIVLAVVWLARRNSRQTVTNTLDVIK
ncbi:MAG TPA: ComEC/Rec2 family competence protein, partial [Candidatus Saccharimonadales bacterium]|nr:ComEC/Rec2 family competence protein [Candidatus Saccharimonadales bacterium]